MTKAEWLAEFAAMLKATRGLPGIVDLADLAAALEVPPPHCCPPSRTGPRPRLRNSGGSSASLRRLLATVRS